MAANEAFENKFGTGAVRSADANETRYDLITPVGLDALAARYGTHDPDLDIFPDQMLGAALSSIYGFLGGDRSDDYLADAAVCIAEAIAFEAGEERGWVLDTPLVEDPDTDGYPYERIPFSFFKATAETYHEGAVKYGDHNWLKGMPCHDILNHAIRHILLYLSGDRSEPHLAHAGWNLLAAIHSFTLWPHLNDGHLRGPGCTPPRVDAAEPETDDADSWWADFLDGVIGEDGDIIEEEPSNIFKELREQGEAGPFRIPTLDHFIKTGQNPPVLYISGPMTGYRDLNFPAFHEAANRLRAKGYPVLNPADFGSDPAQSWGACLERDLQLLSHAAVIVNLPGWEESKGACLENTVAASLGKSIVSLDEIL